MAPSSRAFVEVANALQALQHDGEGYAAAQHGARRRPRRPRPRPRPVSRGQVHRAAGADRRAAVPTGRTDRGSGGRSAFHRHRGAVPRPGRRLVERSGRSGSPRRCRGRDPMSEARTRHPAEPRARRPGGPARGRIQPPPADRHRGGCTPRRHRLDGLLPLVRARSCHDRRRLCEWQPGTADAPGCRHGGRHRHRRDAVRAAAARRWCSSIRATPRWRSPRPRPISRRPCVTSRSCSPKRRAMRRPWRRSACSSPRRTRTWRATTR